MPSGEALLTSSIAREAPAASLATSIRGRWVTYSSELTVTTLVRRWSTRMIQLDAEIMDQWRAGRAPRPGAGSRSPGGAGAFAAGGHPIRSAGGRYSVAVVPRVGDG